MNSLKHFKILLIVLVVFSCSNNITESVIEDVLGQKIFFEVEHINHAWGYMHWGIHIGDTGELYSYIYDPSIKREDQWKPNQEGVYSEQKLLEKFNHNKQFVRTIEKEELVQMILLISGANKGNLSNPVGRMDDAGLWKFKSYTYDNMVREYTEVVLKVDGDWFAENKTWQAQAISLWLETQKAYWLESLR